MASLSALGLPAAAVLLVLCIAGGVCGSREVVAVGSKQREFDYFKLTLLWPGTMCQRTRRCCSANACCRRSNSPNEFTIHGLWPDYNDGSWPACCKRSNFNENEIAKLHDSLEKYWPSFTCDKSPTCYSGKGSFWAHEWEKHGTCCSPVIQDEYNYFLTALNIYFKYNVTKVLHEAGYIPSNTEKYPLGGIVAAIQTAFHINPEIICAERDVEEIRLCFHKDFKPRDCGFGTSLGMNSSSNSCPKLVNLPEHVSPRHAEIEMLTSSIAQSESM